MDCKRCRTWWPCWSVGTFQADYGAAKEKTESGVSDAQNGQVSRVSFQYSRNSRCYHVLQLIIPITLLPCRHLVWTLDKEEVRRILADIERFKTRLGLALQRDNFRLSRAIKEDTAGIEPINRNIAEMRTHTTGIAPLRRDVSAIKTDTAGIVPMGERVNYISENVDTLHANDRTQADASLLKDVLLWLSPLDFRKNHASAAEARISGTGQWFLDCPEFRHWRHSNHETLYCPGIRELAPIS